jgi:drug/metabolite transporter (DMT)-like permease
MPFPRRLPPFVALIAGVVSISWSAIFVRWAEMPGVASAFYRVVLAAGVMWCVLLVRGRLRMERRVVVLAGMAGVCFAGDLGCYNVAVLHTSAGSATFLGNNAPLLVGLMTWMMTKRRPEARFWVALAVGVAGAGLIVSVDGHSLRSGADLLAVGASVCFAMYLMVTERLRTGTETATIVALSTTASALTLGVFAIGAGTSLAVPGVRPLLAVTGLGLVCQLAGYFSLTYALGHVPATVSSVVMLVVAPGTALLAWVFFREAMTGWQLVGGGLILVAVWVVSQRPGAKAPA